MQQLQSLFGWCVLLSPCPGQKSNVHAPGEKTQIPPFYMLRHRGTWLTCLRSNKKLRGLWYSFPSKAHEKVFMRLGKKRKETVGWGVGPTTTILTHYTSASQDNKRYWIIWNIKGPPNHWGMFINKPPLLVQLYDSKEDLEKTAHSSYIVQLCQLWKSIYWPEISRSLHMLQTLSLFLLIFFLNISLWWTDLKCI